MEVIINIKKIPAKPYSKKTYVIPRDLICRSLARIDISIFPFILELFDNKEILSEIRSNRCR